MAFPQFIGILLGVLALYYMVVIALDLAKNSTKKSAAVAGNEHAVSFATEETPEIITDNYVAPSEATSPTSTTVEPPEAKKKTQDNTNRLEDERVNEGSPHVDLGLEEVSSEEYDVTAEELARSVNF